MEFESSFACEFASFVPGAEVDEEDCKRACRFISCHFGRRCFVLRSPARYLACTLGNSFLNWKSLRIRERIAPSDPKMGKYVGMTGGP